MQTIGFTDARHRLKEVLDRVTRDAHYTVITRRDAQDAVVMSLDSFNSLMETVHLLKSLANAAHLARSIGQYRRGETQERKMVNEQAPDLDRRGLVRLSVLVASAGPQDSEAHQRLYRRCPGHAVQRDRQAGAPVGESVRLLVAPLIAESGILGMITDDAGNGATALSIQTLRRFVVFGGYPWQLAECSSARPSPPPTAEAARPKTFSDRLEDGGEGPLMVRVPKGCFRMGDIQGGGVDDEQPVHEVCLDAFAIGAHEVTFADYDRFAAARGRDKPDDAGWDRGERPVINVGWYDANAYAEWVSAQTGEEYPLPTEAEWEFAARARSETRYWWGNEIGRNRANCDGCGSRWDNQQTAPVGSLRCESVRTPRYRGQHLGVGLLRIHRPLRGQGVGMFCQS
jgi:prevent-host-death family protein